MGGINFVKYIQEFCTPVFYCRHHFHTPKQNKLWLVALHVSQTASSKLLANERRDWVQTSL